MCGLAVLVVRSLSPYFGVGEVRCGTTTRRRHRSRRPYTRPAMAWRPSPKAVVLFVSFINLVNYVDRGVISGAPNQFNTFILRTLHAETLR